MNPDSSPLPPSETLDIATFSRLLDDTTNSYKFVFFLAILDLLGDRFFKVDAPFSLQDLTVEMLVIAWYPVSGFRLSFGVQDKIAEKLNELFKLMGKPLLDKPLLKIVEEDNADLRQAIKAQNVSDALGRYVPFRLLRPFFSRELRGLKDNQVNNQVRLAAEAAFITRKPLYKFTTDGTGILIHPDWANYLATHHRIVQGWAMWKWLQYMQKKNPSVPGLANKLFPPRYRESLDRQTKYWETVLTYSPDLQCIYSNRQLTLKDLSLDHYLPWSFVAHNQIWNLLPTFRSVNSSKSNEIPSQVYFERFIQLQHQGLNITYQNLPNKQWTSYVEPYFLDLGFIDQEELLNLETFRKRFSAKFQPLMALAKSQGFEGDWCYRDAPTTLSYLDSFRVGRSDRRAAEEIPDYPNA